MDNPEVLPYYMQAVDSGYLGTRKRNVKAFIEEEDTPMQASDGQSATVGQEDHDEAAEESPQEG